MNEITITLSDRARTITLTDHERSRLWVALIGAAEEASRDAYMAHSDEWRDACEAKAELLLRVAEAVR